MSNLNADVLDIREEILNLIDNAEDEFWAESRNEPVLRNAFSLQIDPDGPIFTVRIEVGGAIRGLGR